MGLRRVLGHKQLRIAKLKFPDAGLKGSRGAAMRASMPPPRCRGIRE